MKVKISGEERDIDLDDLTNREAIALEDHFSMTFDEVVDLAKRGSVKVTTAMVWLVLRRENPELAFEDVEFTFVADDEPADPLEGGDASTTST